VRTFGSTIRDSRAIGGGLRSRLGGRPGGSGRTGRTGRTGQSSRTGRSSRSGGGGRRGGRFGAGLVALGVLVDVFLAGELHDRVDDLVGHGAQHNAVVLQAVVAGEVERGAELDAGPDRQPRGGAAGGLELE